jgi:predicted DNA-binding protein
MTMKKKTDTVMVSIRVDRWMVEKLKKLQEKSGIPVSWTIRKAIERYIGGAH